ncbi:MAG: bifunctional adenosylcobinamide kinase/adenosylcobinamide-phosphate guanylyltransferase [Spirochaetes bacterium]|nr:bifunctional adenosylcobinamide kinase/adenosylcobinamide-phosphate guanylyltransferase [Spirochaetota bacterium]
MWFDGFKEWGGRYQSAGAHRFTDLRGWINQYIASRVDEAVLIVSGLPIKLK